MKLIDRVKRVNFTIVGFTLGVAYWFLESVLHAWLWKSAPISVTLLAQSHDGELEMRLVIVSLLVLFGYFVEHVKDDLIKSVKSEMRFRTLAQGLNAGLVIHRHDTSIAFINQKASNLLGIEANKALGEKNASPVWQFLHEDGTVMPVDAYPVNVVLSTKKPVSEYVVGINFPETNHTNWVMCNAYPSTSDSGEDQVIVSFVDFTEHKALDAQLYERETMFRSTFEQAAIGIAHVGLDGSWLRVNQTLCDMLEYTKDELMKLTFQEITYPDDLDKDLGLIRKLMAGDIENYTMDKRYLTRPGKEIWCTLTASLVRKGDHTPDYFIKVVKDVSDRKRTEKVLLRRESELEEAQAIGRMGSYSLDLINNHWEGSRVLDAIFGINASYDRSIEGWANLVHPEDRETMIGYITGEVFGEKKNFNKEYRIIRQSDQAERWVHGYGKLRIDESGGVVSMQGLIQDVTETVLYRTKLEEASRRLSESVESTLLAVSNAVEARDPHTAGHEKRVALLALAIAQEMGLPAERCHAIFLAATIHDLGKLQVPAEILSKPAQLSEVEYGLVQMHPEVGYNILKHIKSDWPLAEVALQHHERMDGSGYPKGLKGEQIILDARIVGVADVIEAISSHRPYRPALGVNVAVDEVGKGRGSIYDPDVVDACFRLFAENKFSF